MDPLATILTDLPHRPASVLHAPPRETVDTRCPLCLGSHWLHFAERYNRRADPWRLVEQVRIPPERACPMVEDVDYPGPAWYITCAPCECQQPELAARRLRAVLGEPGIPSECERFSFLDFAPLDYACPALLFCQCLVETDALLDNAGLERTGLLIAGPKGCGKTTLASVVFRERIAQGQVGVWIKYAALEEKVRATYRDGYTGPSLIEIRERIAYVHFLLLDDLGSITRREQYAEDMIQFLTLVFDHRLAKRLPTLMTSNIAFDLLVRQFGEPLSSRIAGLCHQVWMAGPDFRTGELP